MNAIYFCISKIYITFVTYYPRLGTEKDVIKKII